MPVSPRLSDEILFSESTRSTVPAAPRSSVWWSLLKRHGLWIAFTTLLVLAFNAVDGSRRALIAEQTAKLAELEVSESKKMQALRLKNEQLVKDLEASAKQAGKSDAYLKALQGVKLVLQDDSLTHEEQMKKIQTLIESSKELRVGQK